MPTDEHLNEEGRRIGPVAITLGYLVAGTAYILISDAFVANVFGDVARTVGTWKGIAFIIVSGTVLYALLRRMNGQAEDFTEGLKRSEQAARQLFLQNPEAMWVYDPDTLACRDVNEAAIERYGWSRDEFLRMTAPDLHPVEDREAVRVALRRHGQGSQRETHARHCTRHGRLMRVALTNHAIRLSGTDAILVVARDMTDLDAAHQALRTREAQLQETTARLQERVKEMQGLDRILRLCNQAGTPVDALLDGVVAALAGALRYPEAAAVRVTLDGRTHESAPFPEVTPAPDRRALIRRPIDGTDGPGLIEIAYRSPVGDAAGALFLDEEEALVDVVAKEVGQTLARRRIAEMLHLRDRGLAAAPTGICIAAREGTADPIIYVNAAFLRISGYEEDEVLGRDCRILQGPETDPATVAAIRASLAGGRTFSGEILNYRKNGQPFWNDLVVSPIHDEAGRVTHFVGVMRDATARYRAQERIRLLESAVESAASAIVVTDAQGKVEYVNSAFERITGYAKDEIAGGTLSALRSDEHDDAFFRTLWETITSGQVWRSPIVNRRKDGSLYRAGQVIAPIRDRRGRIAHFVAIQEDTTALHEAEEQLRHAQRLQAVGQLTGGVAHDFNNILAVILGNLELLDEQITDPGLRELIADPLIATMRGAELTKRLLAFARLHPQQPQPVDIAPLTDRVVDLLRPALTEAIAITVSHGPDLWHAFVDKGQLETALFNIALNAREAMPEGGALLIETANVQLDADYAAVNQEVVAGDYVMIAVTDTGRGMTPEVLAKAFDPFFTTKEPGSGTGLGLSMVYGFAKQSGGHVRIYSEIDRGTIVRLYLPRGGPRSSARGEVESLGMKGGGRIILVVEDDEQVARWIVRALEGAEFKVVDVGDAAEAMRRITEGLNPDMLLTDIVLPGGATGVRLAAALAERGCRSKVLFMSGYSRDAVATGDALPPDARLLNKPFRRAELLQQVHDLLAEGEVT